MVSKKYYAVRNGRKVGIFGSWAECESHIKGYSGAEYKSFSNKNDAESYLGINKNSKIIKDIGELNDEEMIAYVDGSYDDVSKAYGSGVVIWFRGQKSTFSEKGTDPKLIDMRNVAGEIKGAELAIEHALKNNVKKLYLFYDYEGIEKWCTGAWEAKKQGTRSYKTYYINASKTVDVIFSKVQAHSGDKYNDEADYLAKLALENKYIEEKGNNDNIKKAPIKNGKIIPAINIIYNENLVDQEEMISKFKKEWKSKGNTLKSIKELGVVFNTQKGEVYFIVSTSNEEQKIIIKL